MRLLSSTLLLPMTWMPSPELVPMLLAPRTSLPSPSILTPMPGLPTVAVPVPLLGPFWSDRMDFRSVEVSFAPGFDVWIR